MNNNLFYNFAPGASYPLMNLWANGRQTTCSNNVMAKAGVNTDLIGPNIAPYNPFPFSNEDWMATDLGDVDPFTDSAAGDYTLADDSTAIDAITRAVPGLIT